MGKEPQQSPEQDRLAGSVRADHGESFALPHGERDISQDLDSVEGDRKIFYGKDGIFIHGSACSRIAQSYSKTRLADAAVAPLSREQWRVWRTAERTAGVSSVSLLTPTMRHSWPDRKST